MVQQSHPEWSEGSRKEFEILRGVYPEHRRRAQNDNKGEGGRKMFGRNNHKKGGRKFKRNNKGQGGNEMFKRSMALMVCVCAFYMFAGACSEDGGLSATDGGRIIPPNRDGGQVITCDSNLECPSDQVCRSGWCVVALCQRNSQCVMASNEVCRVGRCVLECVSARDCDTGEACIEGGCKPVCTPEYEVCDNLDNDCDELIDEDLTRECETVCGQGLEVCFRGLWVNCSAPEPEEEIPDGRDNDCDGEYDEDFICTPGESQVCGSPLGECQTGMQECRTDGTWGDCVGNVLPQPEVCDSLDNNCDGEVDDGFGTGTSCEGTGVCADAPGLWECNPRTQEVRCSTNPGGSDDASWPNERFFCDGLDNDCDGQVDEDFPIGEPCRGLGACANNVGSFECAEDRRSFQCSVDPGGSEYTGQPEDCDGLDNDCDGEADEGCDCENFSVRPCGYEREDVFVYDGICHPGTQVCVDGTWSECQNTVQPEPRELCNGLDDDCDGQVPSNEVDSDNDGFSPCEGDCDDNNADINPRADELCNGVDDDCDGQVDEGYYPNLTCRAMGECGIGVRECADARSWRCSTEPGGSADASRVETCDGKDNNCDGHVDEGCACRNGTETRCGPIDQHGVGICRMGFQFCVNGQWGVCTGATWPEAQDGEDNVCDYLDNDCDGEADEGLTPSTRANEDHCGECNHTCETPNAEPHCSYSKCVADQCWPGYYNLNGVDADGCEYRCSFEPPRSEVCNALDDDCDGLVDETLTRLCQGDCGEGTEVCVNGEYVGCTAEMFHQCTNYSSCVSYDTCDSSCPDAPSDVCDGRDNDCDGAVDENDPGGGAPCGTLLPGVCAAGTEHCTDGAIRCVQDDDPSADDCDGLDNDCDGIVDEDDPALGTSCDSGRPGRCQSGHWECLRGGLGCVPDNLPIVELCNGVDDDCDGVVDNGNPGGGADCSTGLSGICGQGTEACQGGALVCEQTVFAVSESCDNLDNDCDGAVDENLSQSCNRGCADGTETCQAGQWLNCNAPRPKACIDFNTCQPASMCVDACPAAPEDLCDGRDNDCDGTVDEGDPKIGVACNSVLSGPCRAGRWECNSGVLECIPNILPSSELCNGVDDDCDGQVDENNPEGGGSCSTGQAGICDQGTTSCSAGSLVCVRSVEPGAEVCDNLDNDCDGAVDENLARTCNRGCADGQEVCQAGNWTGCNAPQPNACLNYTTCAPTTSCNPCPAPPTDVCDGVDNDCDGAVDETDPNVGVACDTGLPGRCQTGLKQCRNGGLVCVPNNSPIPELCNGVDDDCDGTVDNGNPGGGAVCGTGLSGICGQGTEACQGGALVCEQTIFAVSETCDNLDNDCDGSVDEGLTRDCNRGCVNGTETCQAGVWVNCDAPTPNTCTDYATCGSVSQCNPCPSAPAEVCDGVDNNCDGRIDEADPLLGIACNTGLFGVCTAGTVACSGGLLICAPVQGPVAEVCGDGLDNNCNGETDETCPPPPGPPVGTITCSAADGVLSIAVAVNAGSSIVDGLEYAPQGAVSFISIGSDLLGWAASATPSVLTLWQGDAVVHTLQVSSAVSWFNLWVWTDQSEAAWFWWQNWEVSGDTCRWEESAGGIAIAR